MPVNYSTPSPESLHAVAGVRLGTAEAGIRKANRRDLTLITLDEGAAVAGVFTQNSFCAAPVVLCRQRLAARKPVRALLVNTGNANAGTGEDGLNAARKSCVALGELLGIEAEAVLPFSTGVILEPLPVDRLIAGLPQAIADLKPDNWHAAAQAIMTTDTIAKAASRRVSASGKELTVTGMAKGAGMIRPNMATMLGFIATDACVAPAVLDRLVAEAADRSFNSITVDGDTSTNDSFMLIASGRGKIRVDSESDPDYAVLSDTVCAVALELAQAIVRDAEGATKFITVTVEDGRDRHECRQVAYAIAHSPLVKTAFFASDPNLGRILAAIGYAGVENLDVDAVEVWLGDNQEEIKVAERGGRALTYREEDGARVMKSAEIGVRVRLARGTARAAVYTCDLSYDYVKINADYRS